MGKQLGRGAVLLVTDQATAQAASTARQLGAIPVLIEDLSARHLDGDPSMVFDVDLRGLDTVSHLKTALASRGDGCRIFLVDIDNRVATVHANVLGAHRLLPRRASVADMHAALDKHFNRGNSAPDDAAVLSAINVGVHTLDSSFAALQLDGKLDTQSVIAACEQIADVVSTLGVVAWLTTVRRHHEGTYQHCMLVTGVAAAFASKTGMSRRDVVRLTMAGLLHDIGKADVPVAVLDKPGALTLREMDLIRLHPVAGYDYLVRNSGIDRDILMAVKHHHEYLDGSGYPDHLAGAEIDAMTRIVTVADIYAALIERRSYKAPKSHAETIAILEAMAAAGKLEARLVSQMDAIMAPGAR